MRCVHPIHTTTNAIDELSLRAYSLHPLVVGHLPFVTRYLPVGICGMSISDGRHQRRETKRFVSVCSSQPHADDMQSANLSFHQSELRTCARSCPNYSIGGAMGARRHEQGGALTVPWRGALTPRKAGKLRGSRHGLPFGPSLGVQILQSFQLQGGFAP